MKNNSPEREGLFFSNLKAIKMSSKRVRKPTGIVKDLPGTSKDKVPEKEAELGASNEKVPEKEAELGASNENVSPKEAEPVASKEKVPLKEASKEAEPEPKEAREDSDGEEPEEGAKDLYFIHGVTPLKTYGTKNKEYFNCILQSPVASRKAVCYSPKKHKLMSDVCDSKSPVKITKLQSDINNNDIIVKDDSEIIISKPRKSFQSDDRLSSDAINTVTDLFSLAPRQLVRQLKCHVTRVFDVADHSTRKGNSINRQDVTISDRSNSIKLVLYGEDVNSLTAGKSYIIKNVRLNTYHDRIYLNTTQERPFGQEEIPPIEAINLSAATETTIMAKIIGISNINIQHFCVSCNNRITPNDDPLQTMQKCGNESCGFQMLLESCRVSANFTLIISNIADNSRTNVFFSMEKVVMLQKILPFPFIENEIAKMLLQFPDIIQVTFDIISKSVINVVKV